MAADLDAAIERQFASGAHVAATFAVPLAPGSIVVLFGPSGSGKTTILRTIAGLDRAATGRLRFGSETWLDSAAGTFVPPQSRRIGCVLQEPALFPHLTVRANVEYGAAGLSRDERARHAVGMLESVDMAAREHSYPAELSGGQAQRVAIARALAPRPRLLLLDEPFAALDMPVRIRLRGLLRALVRQLQIAAVLVTHDRSDVVALGDQMVVIADGEAKQVGPVLDVLRRPADVDVAHAVGVDSVIPAEIERLHEGLVDLNVGGTKLRAVNAGLDGNPREVVACIRGEDVTLERTAAPNVSARNHLSGRIVSIDPDGPLDRVTVDCGFPIVALITRQAREELQLEEGGRVVAAVKATAVHLVPRP